MYSIVDVGLRERTPGSSMCVCVAPFPHIDQLFVWDPVCHSFSDDACALFMMQTTVQPPGKYIIS